MHKAYFLAPLLALLVFSGLYVSHVGGMKERDAQKAAAAEAATQAKLQAEQEARKTAMAEAIAQAERRKQERAAKEARETLEREARQTALDARDKAFREQERGARQIERLKKDLEAEESLLAKLRAEQTEALSEKRFLEEFVTKAQANVQALQTLLAKVPAPAAPAPAK